MTLGRAATESMRDPLQATRDEQGSCAAPRGRSSVAVWRNEKGRILQGSGPFSKGDPRGR